MKFDFVRSNKDCCVFISPDSRDLSRRASACASLLHVPQAELVLVMDHLARQLRCGGLFYCSFKYGVGEVSRDGRLFTRLDETGLTTLLQGLPLQMVESWQTADLRPDRQDECWLNVLLQRQDALHE